MPAVRQKFHLSPCAKFRSHFCNLMKLLKDFYDTRSTVVHGANLREKHHTLLRRVDELRNIVRRLLVAFIRLGNTKPSEHGKKFWKEKLDGVLMNTVEREKLRVALGLLQRLNETAEEIDCKGDKVP